MYKGTEFPYKRGYYWVTKETLSFWDMVYVIDDQIDNTGWWVRFHGQGTKRKLEDFSKGIHWYGPLEEPSIVIYWCQCPYPEADGKYCRICGGKVDPETEC